MAQSIQARLRTIVLECIGDTDILVRPTRFNYLLNSELVSHAARKGIYASFGDLFSVADTIDIDNTGTQFEERVVNPIKRVQGIYD